MGKILGIVIGAIAAALGAVLLIAWRASLAVVIKGILPAFLIFGGVIAIIAAFSEIKDTIKAADRKGRL